MNTLLVVFNHNMFKEVFLLCFISVLLIYEMKRNEAKWSEMKRNEDEMKRNEYEMKRNVDKIKRNEAE